jgi:hypothetical protein
MVQVFLIGLGAGAASALLFASIVSGSPLAILLFYLSALPLMLAAIAWSHMAGLFAVVFGALSLAAALNYWIAFVYLASVATPAYVLAYMSMLGREVAPASATTPPQMEWYPVGRIVLWAGLIAFALVTVVILQFGTSFETYQKTIRATFESVLKIQARIPADQPLKLPGVQSPEQFLNMLVAVMPPAAAVLSMLTSIINLWLAARVARVSGKLRRPWPDLNAVSLPLAAALFLAAALVASFLSGMPGFIAAIAVAVLLVAYAITGFSVLHAITRGAGARTWILAGAWIGVALFGWPLLFIALLGIADTVFDLRGKVAARNKPPSPPIQSNKN